MKDLSSNKKLELSYPKKGFSQPSSEKKQQPIKFQPFKVVNTIKVDISQFKNFNNKTVNSQKSTNKTGNNTQRNIKINSPKNTKNQQSNIKKNSETKQPKLSQLKKNNIQKKVQVPQTPENKMEIEDYQEQNQFDTSGKISKSTMDYEMDFICQEINFKKMFYFDYDKLVEIKHKELRYKIDYENLPINLNNYEFKRQEAIDWCLKVCDSLHKKRSTAYISIYCFDKLATLIQIQTNQLLLKMASTLLMISKLEEYSQISVQQIRQALRYEYSEQCIFDREQEIIIILNYQLNSITLDDHLSICTKQWDQYLTQFQNCEVAQNLLNSKAIFRDPLQNNFQFYQQVCIIVDFCLYSTQIYKYEKLYIILSIMYCFIQCYFNHLGDINYNSYFQELEMFPNHQFENYFNEFLQNCINISIDQLLPCVKYVGKYICHQIVINSPFSKYGQTYEDQLSFQCYKRNQLQLVQSINR